METSAIGVMATQDSSGIDFAIVPESHHQHFRLLELPPELLALLTSEDPPALQFKSAEGPAGEQLETNVVLCTHDKTFNIRQVSTSNSLFIAQTRPPSSAGENDFPLNPRIEAIGKATSTLETQPCDHSSAHPFLRAALPVWTSSGHAGSDAQVSSKAALFADVPLSTAECERAWTDLACFELRGPPPRCFVPAPAVRWRAWQVFRTLAGAESLDLSAALPAARMADLAREAGDELPTELVLAVLRSVCARWADDEVELDGEKCARFVGIALLRERCERGAYVDIAEFVESWKDQLPRQWESLAKVEVLTPSGLISKGGKLIKYVEAEDGTVTAEGKLTLGTKRNWHEKFRASKKTA